MSWSQWSAVMTLKVIVVGQACGEVTAGSRRHVGSSCGLLLPWAVPDGWPGGAKAAIVRALHHPSQRIPQRPQILVLQCPHSVIPAQFDGLTQVRPSRGEVAKLRLVACQVEMEHRDTRQVIFQMAEVAIPRELFCDILRAIERLRLVMAATG